MPTGASPWESARDFGNRFAQLPADGFRLREQRGRGGLEAGEESAGGQRSRGEALAEPIVQLLPDASALAFRSLEDFPLQPPTLLFPRGEPRCHRGKSHR